MAGGESRAMKKPLAHPLSVRLFLPLLTLLWGPGCGTIENESKTGEAPPELPLVQVEQGVSLVYTLRWPDNRATGDCRFGDLAAGNQAPRNGYASGRLEQPLPITGLAGRRITSMRLSSTNNTSFKYDDVMVLHYNNYILMSSDRRVAQYSHAPNALGASPVQYVWSKILNQPIDNQNLQPAWCSSGATGADCAVPVTETVGTMNVNLSSFEAVDEAAYPSRPDERIFTLVTIGDDEPAIDCRHGDVTLTLTVEACSPEVCDGKDNDCDGLVDEGLGTVTCGVGACQRTVAACTNGSAGICTPGTPSPETRDNIDNNCNGYVDENYLVNVPVSTLSSLVSDCTSTDLNSTVGYSRACIAAARRYCNSTGWEGGTIVEYSPPSVYLACFRAQGSLLPVSTLTNIVGSCTEANIVTTKEYSKACNAAASRYCRSTGYMSGLPQEFGRGNIYVNCSDQAPSYGYFSNVPNGEWAAMHGGCDSAPLAGPDVSKGCRAAAHRWCYAKGGAAVSGVPVEWGTHAANIMCIYL